MSTNKRFYVEDAFKCYFLRDRATPINDIADKCVHTAAIGDHGGVKYLYELCGFLNKGHEATEELHEEFIYCGHPAWPDPLKVHPPTRENALSNIHEYGRGYVKRRLVSDWEKIASADD